MKAYLFIFFEKEENPHDMLFQLKMLFHSPGKYYA